MAGSLRYDAAGGVSHLMARGDGGKDVFEDDKDRFAWVDLLEKAHGRIGWRVRAWVLMGSHFHLLLETPEPNLVEATFGEKVLAAIKGAVGGERKRSSVGGAAAKAHDEAEAERLVAAALAELGAPGDATMLAGRGRWKEEKEMVAALVRNRTAVAKRWVSARLGMGHEVSVTRAVRRYRTDPKSVRKLKALERKLGTR